MASASQRPKGRNGVLSTLDLLIQGLNLVKDACSIQPAQIAFGSVSALLTVIRDTMANSQGYVELGISCADVCNALKRGLEGRRLDELSHSVLGAIEQLTTTVTEIQSNVVEKGKRHAISRAFHAKTDKDAITAWQQDLNRILHIFNTELLINNHMILLDIRRNALAGKDGTVGGHQSAQVSVPLGELPPPPPRVCFGRDGLVEEIVGLVGNLEPVALIGAGGIGKTSIALSVLHHDHVKTRFGHNRRFIRCDQFPASHAHFLSRLSKVIGAGIQNPEDLAPLRPFLSSGEMILFLDNAESILDPAGPDAREIYAVVEELTRFDNICLGITTRISTVPPHCKRPIIPTLSMESACDIFYSIYTNRGRSDIISDLVRRLDFHALSITLLATVASHSMWDYDRLAKEWEAKRAQVLRTDHNESLATAIELSFASQTFRKLTPSPSLTPRKRVASSIFHKLIPSSMPRKLAPGARELLEVVAFFPQGIDENNIDWLFPTISDRRNIFDKFCILSLTYRSNGFITMLAPIRDYLTPKDPKSSPLLCASRDHYLSRLSVAIGPDMPGFEEAGWIVLEDVNVEHLLDVFASIDPNAGVWDACYHFMQHLRWYKPRQTVLRQKIEGLSDDHPSKPKCLSKLSWLSARVGNRAEQKRLLAHALKLERQRGDGSSIAQTLRYLSDANRVLGLHEEGIQQAKEALEIYERIGDTIGQTACLNDLGWSLFSAKQLDAAKDAASRVIDLVPEKGQEHLVCKSHRLIGNVYRSKGEKEDAIHHLETALGIAAPLNWKNELFWNHYSLVEVFLGEGEFDDANVHVEQAKSHVVNDTYQLGRAMEIQAQVWYRQGRLEDATSEALSALEVHEKLGAGKDVGVCKDLLQKIEETKESRTDPRGL